MKTTQSITRLPEQKQSARQTDQWSQSSHVFWRWLLLYLCIVAEL